MFTFVKIRGEHLPMVLDWRTKPRVADVMFTRVGYDMDKQWAWFAQLDHPYWIVCHNGRPIGTLSHFGDQWGYYIGEDDAVPLGALVPPYFYNYVFKKRDFIQAEVMTRNERAARMHLFHGYRKVGQSVFHAADIYELRKADWVAQAKRYGHMVAEFP